MKLLGERNWYLPSWLAVAAAARAGALAPNPSSRPRSPLRAGCLTAAYRTIPRGAACRRARCAGGAPTPRKILWTMHPSSRDRARVGVVAVAAERRPVARCARRRRASRRRRHLAAAEPGHVRWRPSRPRPRPARAARRRGGPLPPAAGRGARDRRARSRGFFGVIGGSRPFTTRGRSGPRATTTRGCCRFSPGSAITARRPDAVAVAPPRRPALVALRPAGSVRLRGCGCRDGRPVPRSRFSYVVTHAPARPCRPPTSAPVRGRASSPRATACGSRAGTSGRGTAPP